jgi:hypothetical protein
MAGRGGSAEQRRVCVERWGKCIGIVLRATRLSYRIRSPTFLLARRTALHHARAICVSYAPSRQAVLTPSRRRQQISCTGKPGQLSAWRGGQDGRLCARPAQWGLGWPRESWVLTFGKSSGLVRLRRREQQTRNCRDWARDPLPVCALRWSIIGIQHAGRQYTVKGLVRAVMRCEHSSPLLLLLLLLLSRLICWRRWARRRKRWPRGRVDESSLLSRISCQAQRDAAPHAFRLGLQSWTAPGAHAPAEGRMNADAAHCPGAHGRRPPYLPRPYGARLAPATHFT